jgi:hypothetical protein
MHFLKFIVKIPINVKHILIDLYKFIYYRFIVANHHLAPPEIQFRCVLYLQLYISKNTSIRSIIIRRRLLYRQ